MLQVHLNPKYKVEDRTITSIGPQRSCKIHLGRKLCGKRKGKHYVLPVPSCLGTSKFSDLSLCTLLKAEKTCFNYIHKAQEIMNTHHRNIVNDSK